jgi:hypothetical protein
VRIKRCYEGNGDCASCGAGRGVKELAPQSKQAPDGQISLTDSDARSMATSGRGTGIVGYNVQTAVETQHHLIVAHEVTNVGHDRTQLSRWPSRRVVQWEPRS